MSRSSYSYDDLAGLLGGSLGHELALQLVGKTGARLGLPPGSMGHEDALRVLEDIASEPGLVGISARFVKSRLLLEAPEPARRDGTSGRR